MGILDTLKQKALEVTKIATEKTIELTAKAKEAGLELLDDAKVAYDDAKQKLNDNKTTSR